MLSCFCFRDSLSIEGWVYGLFKSWSCCSLVELSWGVLVWWSDYFCCAVGVCRDKGKLELELLLVTWTVLGGMLVWWSDNFHCAIGICRDKGKLSSRTGQIMQRIWPIRSRFWKRIMWRMFIGLMDSLCPVNSINSGLFSLLNVFFAPLVRVLEVHLAYGTSVGMTSSWSGCVGVVWKWSGFERKYKTLKPSET